MTYGTLPRLHVMQGDHAVPRLLERCRDISLPLVVLRRLLVYGYKIPNLCAQGTAEPQRHAEEAKSLCPVKCI